MRKIFESMITVVVAGLTLFLSTKWYLQGREIEPLIGIIAASGVLLTALVYRIFPEKKEVAESTPPIRVEQRENTVEQSQLSAEQNIVIGKGNTIQQNFITYAGDKKIPCHLTNSPFRSEYFIGREQDMEAIEGEYQRQIKLLMLVNGDGGMGKTTLAAHYWYVHESRYKHLAWLNADRGIGMALFQLAQPLGLRFGPQDDEAAQINRVVTAIHDLDMPCLLVFDNANDEADLKKHYAALRKLSKCHILLTSRVAQLQGAPVHRVKPLDDPKTLELFKHHYPQFEEGEAPLLRDILKAVGHNTLVTELLAKNLAQFNRFQTRYRLADLLSDLQQKGLLGLKNKTVSVVYGSDTLREAAPTDIIAAMYDLSQLSDDEQCLLSNLSALPADHLGFDALRELLGAGADTLLDAPLEQLVDKGWLEHRLADNSIKISPVVQEVTKAKNRERLRGDCAALIEALRTGLDPEASRQADYDYARAARFAYYGWAVAESMPEPDDDTGTLCQNIGKYHQDTGNLNLMMAAYQKMLDIQAALCVAEPDNADFKNGLAISYEKLGLTHTALGDLERALTFFEDETKLFEELYAANPTNVGFKNGLAISYAKLGETHTALGDLERALTFFEQYNQLEKELHEAFPQNVEFKNVLAISYAKLGEFNRDQVKDVPKAKGYFQRAEKLWVELVRDAPAYVQFQRYLELVRQEIAELK
jgi:tetratricopeptide (TPR) repeat protein